MPPRGGLDKRSIVLTWQTIAISAERVVEIRGVLADPVDHRKIRLALAELFGIPWHPE